MDSIILNYLTLWSPVGYIVLFFGMMIEGDALLFLASFLASQGHFNSFSMFAVAFAGVIIGDACWYSIGKNINPESFFARWVHKLTHKFDSHLIDRPFRTIFISKFMYGFHHAILMRAGALRVPRKKFAKIDLVASIVWMIIIGCLGYLSGASFILIKKSVRYVEVGLAIALLIYAILEKTITALLKRQL